MELESPQPVARLINSKRQPPRRGCVYHQNRIEVDMSGNNSSLAPHAGVRMFLYGDFWLAGSCLEEVGFWVTSPAILPVGSLVELPLARSRWGGDGHLVTIIGYRLDYFGQLWVECGTCNLHRIGIPNMTYAEAVEAVLSDGGTSYEDVESPTQ